MLHDPSNSSICCAMSAILAYGAQPHWPQHMCNPSTRCVTLVWTAHPSHPIFIGLNSKYQDKNKESCQVFRSQNQWAVSHCFNIKSFAQCRQNKASVKLTISKHMAGSWSSIILSSKFCTWIQNLCFNIKTRAEIPHAVDITPNWSGRLVACYLHLHKLTPTDEEMDPSTSMLWIIVPQVNMNWLNSI